MSFPNLADFAVTLANGDDSWRSEQHTGFILKVDQLRSNHRLQIKVQSPPMWLRNAGEVEVAVHASGQTWNQRFALRNKNFNESDQLTLVGETTGGEEPYWN